MRLQTAARAGDWRRSSRLLVPASPRPVCVCGDMSYGDRNHRGYHPYQRDQPAGYRHEEWRGSANGHSNQARGSGADGYSDIRQFSQYQAPGSFQSPPDRRFYQNGGPPPFSQSYDSSRRVNCPPQSYRPFHHQPHSPYPDHGADRPLSRYSTGSYDNISRYNNNRQADMGQRNLRRESDPVPFAANDRRSNAMAPNADLQSRTLRVTEFHSDVTKELLKELFNQVGPVRNVVLRPDHAFIEFQDTDSVAYALAAMDGVHIFGVPLRMEPKLNDPAAYRFFQQLKLFERQPELFGIVQ